MNDCHAFKCGCEGREGWHEYKTRRLMAQVKHTTRVEQTNLEVRIDAALKEVRKELLSAIANFPEFRSAHEGVAIIEEEFLELREAAYWPHRPTTGDEDTEATQLAAMACRYLVDVCYQENTPR